MNRWEKFNKINDEVRPFQVPGEPFIKPSEDWAPLCLECLSNDRMEITEYGWQCQTCKTKVDKALNIIK